jgi:predicted transcriptional regulator
MTRYSIHPLEQQFNEWNSEYIQRRDNYWRMLRAAWADYQAADHGPYGEPNFASFNYYMQKRYGMRVNMTAGNIDSSYQILDDKKHTLFLLKYA